MDGAELPTVEDSHVVHEFIEDQRDDDAVEADHGHDLDEEPLLVATAR